MYITWSWVIYYRNYFTSLGLSLLRTRLMTNSVTLWYISRHFLHSFITSISSIYCDYHKLNGMFLRGIWQMACCFIVSGLLCFEWAWKMRRCAIHPANCHSRVFIFMLCYTSGAETAYPSPPPPEDHEFTSMCSILYIIVFSFSFTIVLSLPRLSVSDSPFFPLSCLFLDYRLLIPPFVHCLVPPSIIGFWFPLWYPQTFLIVWIKMDVPTYQYFFE